MAPRARLMQTELAFSYLIKHVDLFDTDITLVLPSDTLGETVLAFPRVNSQAKQNKSA